MVPYDPYGEYYSYGLAQEPPPPAPSGNRELGPYGTATFVWSALSTASMAASAYHGYKRNNSIGWAIGWGALGALFPIITPAIALAQGFGKPKSR